MAKYHNKTATRLIGKRIQALRNKAGLSIEDMTTMTGFQRTTITAIEAGSNTDLSHFVEIAFALQLHPKALLDIDFEIKPRFALPATRKEKNKLTARINFLIKEGFFKRPKTSKEVCNELMKRYPEAINIKTKNVSVILKRQSEQEKLSITGTGRKHLYQER